MSISESASEEDYFTCSKYKKISDNRYQKHQKSEKQISSVFLQHGERNILEVEYRRFFPLGKGGGKNSLDVSCKICIQNSLIRILLVSGTKMIIIFDESSFEGRETLDDIIMPISIARCIDRTIGIPPSREFAYHIVSGKVFVIKCCHHPVYTLSR
jgi:hypothetical protein